MKDAQNANNVQESLSDKMTEGKMHQFDHAEIFLAEDVKEKIQNAQKRLKETIEDTQGSSWIVVENLINKIFLEEFGRKLI